MNVDHKLRPELKIRRVNLDTGRENIVVISRHSRTLRPEVFADSAVSSYKAERNRCWPHCSSRTTIRWSAERNSVSLSRRFAVSRVPSTASSA